MDCQNIIFSRHAIQQMFLRRISKRDVQAVIAYGEVIEENPDDTPFPSYLLLNFVQSRPIHVVFSYDESTDTGYVVAAYIPAPSFGLMILELGDRTMRCVICKHGETEPGLVTVTLERDESIVIIKRVPAEVCDNCGEYYLSDVITEQVLQRAEMAVSNGAEVEIIRYAA